MNPKELLLILTGAILGQEAPTSSVYTPVATHLYKYIYIYIYMYMYSMIRSHSACPLPSFFMLDKVAANSVHRSKGTYTPANLLPLILASATAMPALRSATIVLPIFFIWAFDLVQDPLPKDKTWFLRPNLALIPMVLAFE
jgi:hypothetical protein